MVKKESTWMDMYSTEETLRDLWTFEADFILAVDSASLSGEERASKLLYKWYRTKRNILKSLLSNLNEMREELQEIYPYKSFVSERRKLRFR